MKLLAVLILAGQAQAQMQVTCTVQPSAVIETQAATVVHDNEAPWSPSVIVEQGPRGPFYVTPRQTIERVDAETWRVTITF